MCYHYFQYYQEAVDSLLPAARESRGHLVFAVMDSERDEIEKALEFFEVEDEDQLPVYMIFEIEKNARYTSSHNAVMDADAIAEFCRKHREGTLARTLKGKDAPKDWDKKPVKVTIKRLVTTIYGR